MKKQKLHFQKEEGGYSHSKIQQDQSSLNVSALTAMGMIHRPSSSTGSRVFVANPPPLVRALVQAKVAEARLRARCEEMGQQEL